MAIILTLEVFNDGNPFNGEERWVLDLKADTPQLIINATAGDFPLATFARDLDSRHSWSAEFTPPLNTSSGKVIAFLWRDGDTLFGSAGDDILRLTDHDDQATGNWGNDWIEGRGGNDWLRGGADDDRVYGGDGNDRLDGVGGIDTLVGGPGNDMLMNGEFYVFDAALGPGNVDHIERFYAWFGSDGADKLRLDTDVFPKLKPGKLKAKFFDAGNRKADDKNDYLVYHKKSGGVYYDHDGNRKKHDPILFAILDNKPKKLSQKDFAIFDDG